jgi:hypothetical protein
MLFGEEQFMSEQLQTDIDAIEAKLKEKNT